MPVGIRLQSVCGIQNSLLIERPADQLQANWHSVDESGRCREAWQPGKIDCQRVDVLHIHRDRVLLFGAERECNTRSGWACDDVDLLEGAMKILGNHPTNLL